MFAHNKMIKSNLCVRAVYRPNRFSTNPEIKANHHLYVYVLYIYANPRSAAKKSQHIRSHAYVYGAWSSSSFDHNHLRPCKVNENAVSG